MVETGYATIGQPLNIDPNSGTQQEALNIDPMSKILMPVSNDTANARSFKAYYGLGDIIQKSRDQIFGDISSGNEDQLRELSADTINQRKQQATQDAITQLAANKGGVLTNHDIDFVTNAVNSMDQKTDPNTIFETSFAREYFNAMDRAGQRNSPNAWTQAQQNIPVEHQNTVAAGELVQAKQNILEKYSQNARDLAESQGIVPWSVDQLKYLFPGYQDWINRGNVKEASKLGTLGENMEEQARVFNQEMDLTKYDQRAKAIYDDLTARNPSAAVAFFDALKGMSSRDVALNTLLPMIDYATIAEAGIKGAGLLASRAVMYNNTANAVRTGIKALENTDKVTNAAILGSTGDLRESAIAQATTSKVAELQGIPQVTKDMLDAATTDLRIDKQARFANPGRFGQEIVNRINERTDSTGINWQTLVANAQKVERTPEIVNPTETVARAIEEDIRDKYVGYSNRILDIQPAYKEPATGVWFKDLIVGDHGGTYFFSPEVRDNFMKENPELGGYASTSEGNVPLGAGLSDSQFAKAQSLEKTIKEMQEVSMPRELNRLTESGVNFTTAKGSTYDVRPDGTTIRNKAARDEPGHEGDFGIKPKSERTVYVTHDVAQALAPPQGKWRIIESKGTISLATPNNGKWGISPSQRNLSFSNSPAKGLHPVELWDHGLTQGQRSYGEMHVGNQITDISDKSLTPAQRTRSQEQLAGMQDMLPKLQAQLKELVGEPNQQGIGYYIRVPVPVEETTGRIKNVYETEAQRVGSKTVAPDSFVNRYLGWLRTPEDTMSMAHLENRKTVTVSPHVAIKFLQENAQAIKQIGGWRSLKNNQRWNDFKRVLIEGTKQLDENGEMGKFFKSPGELEDFYQEQIGRLPDEKEIEAYFAFTDAMEYDRQFRNLAEHRNQLRLGVQTHTILTRDAASGKQIVRSEPFSAVKRTSFPHGSQGNVLVVGSRLGQEEVKSVGHINSALEKQYAEMVNTGSHTMLELYSPSRRPLSGFGETVGNTRIRYVLAPNVETKPLDWNHVPRRGGGHIVYDYDHYLKQAIVRGEEVGNRVTNIYEGDRTIAALSNRKMGQNFAKHLNQVRELLKDQKVDEAQAYANQNLHVSWDKIANWFKEERDSATGRITKSALSLDEPIMVVPKGKQIVDMDDGLRVRNTSKLSDGRTPEFIDGTRSGDLSRQFQVEFTGERDAESLDALYDKGTKNNPLYDIQPAEALDPISTMNRGLTRIINTNYMDDYKIFSVEHWMAQARHYLNLQGSAGHGSFWHFMNADSLWLSSTPEDIKARLQTERMNVLNLLNTPTKTDSRLQALAQDLADATYSGLGPKHVLDTKWALPVLRDPFRFMRSIVFHTTLGLFNLPQIIIQAMNFVNTVGIAGTRYGLSGTLASQMHIWSMVNRHPEILEHLDGLASKFNIPGLAAWRPGEYKEAFNEMAKTGWGDIGREVATLDDVLSTKLWSNGFQSFIDAGMYFFKKGEENARYTAWYTAYKEWRDANPTRIIDNASRAEILQRADMLNVNMTRASSSILHKGVWSIPAQFYTYQLRLTELFLSKRLTNAERARLFAANAIMFGVPVGTGLAGFPFSDMIRQGAIDNGYVVGDNFLTSLAMEGIPSFLIAMSTGNWTNFGDRYGSRGFDPITNAMRSDRTILDVVGGAAYSKFANTWADTDGFRAWFMSAFRDDGKYFPLTAENIAKPLREIQSVNAGWRLAAALNAGKWLSRKETFLEDINPVTAAIYSLTGLQSQQVADVTRKTASINDTKAAQKYGESKFRESYQKFLAAHADNNPQQADEYMKEGLAWLAITGYPMAKFSNLVAEVSAGANKSLVDTIDWDYYIRYAADQDKMDKYNTYVKIQQMKEKK